MRDRLIELLNAADKRCSDTKRCADCVGFGHGNECVNHLIADHLLAEGVVVPQVWVGSTVYYIYDILGEICFKEMCVVECVFDKQGLYSLRAETFDHRMSLPFSRNHPYYSLNTLRFTKEEAEQALRERSENGT